MRNQLLCTLLLSTLVFSALESRAQTPASQDAPQAPSPANTAPQQPAIQAPNTSNAPNTAQPQQGPNGTYTIQRSARLVILDVVVTDSKGNVVTDLKKEDFQVTEAAEPQTIQNFEPAGAHTLSPDLNINSTTELDRLAPRAPVNIILLDEFNTRFEDMAFARYSLKKFLEKQPDKLSTPTMLLAVNLQNFTVLQDYTQNKQAVINALDHHFVAFPWQAHQQAWVSERFTTAFGTLMRVAQATVGHPGHKNMIWIGRGFPALNFANLQVDASSRVDNAVQQCVNALRDARVTLYSIDPAGLQVNNTYGSEAQFVDPFGGNYTFNKLAVATGGKALYGRNDVDAEIGTGVRDGASFYTLTYRPTNADLNPQKFRKIKVTLTRPGLTATTREGYYIQRGPGRVDPTNPSRRLAFDLVNAESSTMAYDGVPLTLTADPTNPDSFTIHVDARGLVWSPATDTEPRHAEVIVMASSFDKKGKELKRIAKSVKVSAPTDVAPTGRLDRALNLVFKLDHDPKATRARFVVRVTATGRIGTADPPLGQQASAPPSTPRNPHHTSFRPNQDSCIVLRSGETPVFPIWSGPVGSSVLL